MSEPEHEHHPDDLDESISNFDWAMRAIQRATHQWRLDFIAESLGAAKDGNEDWTKSEADMQRLRDAWKIKHEELR